MQHMELTTEESSILREIVEQAIKEIGLEIHRTDTLSYRDMLIHRRKVLEQLRDKLEAVVPA